MDIIDRINVLLAKKGKSGAEMSRDLGFSNSAYSQWNTRKTKPSKKSIFAIAEYLGTTAEYLLQGDNEKAPTTNGERPVTDDDIKFALFGGSGEITDAMYDEVRNFAAYVRQREEQKKKG